MRKIFREGFTLTELIIVVVIIGILASIAIPVISSNVNRARRSEAIAVIGAIRSAERMCYTEFGKYASFTKGSLIPTTNLNMYIDYNELNGSYYNADNYRENPLSNLISANSTNPALNVNMNIITGSVDNP